MEFIKTIAIARNVLRLSNFKENTVTELICSNQVERLDKPVGSFNKISLLLAEIGAIARFNQNYDDMLILMKLLQDLTTDVLVLGKAFQLLHNSIYHLLDREMIVQIQQNLEKMLLDLDNEDEEKALCYTILGIVKCVKFTFKIFFLY